MINVSECFLRKVTSDPVQILFSNSHAIFLNSTESKRVFKLQDITSWNSLTELIVGHGKIRSLLLWNASATRSDKSGQNHRPFYQHDHHLGKLNLLICLWFNSKQFFHENSKRNQGRSSKRKLAGCSMEDDFIDVWHLARIRSLFYSNLWRHRWSDSGSR